jgi:hypothetical protein
MLRQSSFGNTALMTAALERFPPPEFLTDMQRNLWIAALSDVPLEFFRARHIPMMIQYVRAVEHMMRFSDIFEKDPDDTRAMMNWDRMSRIVTRYENQLSLGTSHIIQMVLRARAEVRVANQAKRQDEVGESSRDMRTGLTYVGHG